MASLPLTLRNLTATPITLKRVERFEDPNSQQSSAFPFASRNTTSLAPAALKLGEHAQSFNREDIDIRLLPFESYTLKACKDSKPESTNNHLNTQHTTTTFRITLETPDAQRHRIDTNPTYTQKSSQLLTPLTPSPSTTLSAIYHPPNPTPHLTIHQNHLQNLSKWMSTLPSTLPLSALSIPGTHNSHTHYRALPSVRCQSVPVKTQLENGIRFLDIRVQPTHPTDPSKKDLYLVHGAFPISLTGSKLLSPVLQSCYDFLTQNPSETLLLSLKREGTGNATDELLSRILLEHYFIPNQQLWYLGDEIPSLGAVRGKIVLIRRYTSHPPLPNSPQQNQNIGLNATTWPHNSTHALTPPFCIQDFCDVLAPTAIPHKLVYSTAHLDRAAACTAFIPGVNTDVENPVPPGPIFLNFLSGSNFWRTECWPKRIADVVNRGVEEWVCRGLGVELASGEDGEGEGEGNRGLGGVVRKAREGDGSTGVVIMDHVGDGGDWDLVRLIVGCNMGVLRSAVGGEGC